MVGQTRFQRDNHRPIDGQHHIESLIDCLSSLNITYEVDAPLDHSGEWWIDLSFDNFSTTVAWRSDRGFGIFTSDEDAYGARPDEIYREPQLAAKRIRQLADRTDGAQSTMRLSEVRKLLDQPQTAVASILNKDQGFISKLEHRDDALLSTLRDYIEALGGEMKLMVHFNGFDAPVALPRKLAKHAIQAPYSRDDSSKDRDLDALRTVRCI